MNSNKPNICVSFILLFSFLSAVLANHELPEISLREEPSSDSFYQNAIDNGFPSPPAAYVTDFLRQEKGNVLKNPKPTSSQNLEMDQSGVSSRSSLRHSVRPRYTIPTLEEKENQQYGNEKVSKERNPTSSYDLERKRRSDSNMHKFNKRHGYKSTSTEETGKSDVLKGNVEADKLEMEDIDWKVTIGSGNGGRSNGRGIPGNDAYGNNGGYGNGGYGNGGFGNGGFGNGGWGGDFISNEPMNYKDASTMKHQNMKKFSEFDRESFLKSQAAKKFAMKNVGKISYGDVLRMEDAGEDKKN